MSAGVLETGSLTMSWKMKITMSLTTTRNNYKERNDIRATSQVLQNFDLSLDLLLFHWLEDLYHAFIVVSNVDGFEYFRVFSSTELSHKLEEIF